MYETSEKNLRLGSPGFRFLACGWLINYGRTRICSLWNFLYQFNWLVYFSTSSILTFFLLHLKRFVPFFSAPFAVGASIYLNIFVGRFFIKKKKIFVSCLAFTCFFFVFLYICGFGLLFIWMLSKTGIKGKSEERIIRAYSTRFHVLLWFIQYDWYPFCYLFLLLIPFKSEPFSISNSSLEMQLAFLLNLLA